MPGMWRTWINRAAALLANVLLAGCIPWAGYSPAGIDEQAAPTQFLSRTADDSTLANLVEASGYPSQWPPQHWRLDSLTLLALYFNPELDVVRAQARSAHARLAVAARRSPRSVQLAAEHHSRETDGDGPWSLGLAIDLPVGGGSRRQARIERASLLADAAELAIATAAWDVRSAVRDAVIKLSASEQRMLTLQQRQSMRKQMSQLVQRRVDAGMLSSRESDVELHALAVVEAELARERTQYASVRGDLARALGLPLETSRALSIANDALSDITVIPDAVVARNRALRNRLDIHTRLLEFGTADAEVRIEIAAQYPTIKLSPGFFWDQGDNIWSLLNSVVLPNGAHATIRAAEARRETAARKFAALQINVIGEVDHARDVLKEAQLRLQSATDMLELMQMQLQKMRRLFESGGADQVQVLASRLAHSQAQWHLLAAQEAWQESIARFEDATQYPVLGDFLILPQAQRSLSQSMPRNILSQAST